MKLIISRIGHDRYKKACLALRKIRCGDIEVIVCGAGLRNTFLALVGKYLKENRELVMKYSKIVDIVVLIILIGIIGRFVYRQVRKRKRKNHT